MIFSHLEERRRSPEKLFRLCRGIESASAVVRVDTCLQLANPIPAFRKRQTWITLQMMFEAALVEPFIVQEAEFGRQATQGPDQTELRGDNLDDQTETRFPREFEPFLGFSLHLAKRITACQ